MECKNCKQNFEIKIATKIDTKGCQVLTNLTTIITVKCESCNHISQIPVSSNTILSVKPDKKD